MANCTIGSSQAIASTTVTKPSGVVDGSVLVIRYHWFVAGDQHLVFPTCSNSFVDVGSVSSYDPIHAYTMGVSFFRKVIASAAGEPSTYTITPVSGRDVDLGQIDRLVNCDTTTPETDAGQNKIVFGGGTNWTTGAAIDSGTEDLLLIGVTAWAAPIGTPGTMAQNYLLDGAGDIGGYSENTGVVTGATRTSTTGANDGSAIAFVVFKAGAGGGGGGRTTKNTRAFPLGVEVGMNIRGGLS